MVKKILTGVAVLTVGAACSLPTQAAVEVGEEAPDFILTSIDGNEHSLSDFRGQFVVLEWVNHGCPFVRKFYDVGEMQRLQEEFTAQDVIWLSICSSRSGEQGYMTKEEARAAVAEIGSQHTAYLYDEPGDVGRLFGARVTPHMFVIDPDGVLIYQGAIDSVRSANPADIEGAENYVVSALEQAMAGEEVVTPVTTAYGCTVKY